jgi:hypothetical protein
MPSSQTPPRTLEDVLNQLRTAGFEVSREAGCARVRLGHCAAVLEAASDSRIRFTEPPGYIVGRHIARLEDRGFQKFLCTPDAQVPALAEHLTEVHRFSERLRTALKLRTLYNQSLGTVSDRYLYDRVSGCD